MKAYPKIGTRVRVIAGEHAGRQAKTHKTTEGRGRIELELLGGTHALLDGAPIEWAYSLSRSG